MMIAIYSWRCLMVSLAQKVQEWYSCIPILRSWLVFKKGWVIWFLLIRLGVLTLLESLLISSPCGNNLLGMIVVFLSSNFETITYKGLMANEIDESCLRSSLYWSTWSGQIHFSLAPPDQSFSLWSLKDGWLWNIAQRLVFRRVGFTW